MTMKKNVLLLFVSLLVFLMGYGQQSADYKLYLKSGHVLLSENAAAATKNDDVFTSSLRENKYYFIIQFYKLPAQWEKEALENAGLKLIDYLPKNTYTAVASKEFNLELVKNVNVRSFATLSSVQKSSPQINSNIIPAYTVKSAGTVDINVETFEAIPLTVMQNALSGIKATIIESTPQFRSFVIRAQQSNFKQIASIPFVQWMEFIEAPNTIENLPGRTLHRTNILQSGTRNLLGNGINIGIWDGGSLGTHADFLPAGRITNVETPTAIQHGTHCAGTIGGKGLLNPIARGMAPNAAIFSWDFAGNIQSEMASGIPNFGLNLSSHSYGSSGTPVCDLSDGLLAYTTTARNTDINTNNFNSHLHVHSAGNSQSACAGNGGFLTITGSGKSAKNNLVVANINSTEVLSSSSSAGPVQDGRIKPEIAGLGTSVFSTSTPANGYATLSGTSMATPGVAGTAALLYQRFKQLNSNNNPASALIKNVICNTAKDLGNPGPDYKFGFGRIDALAAVRVLEQNRYVSGSVTPLQVAEFPITVPAGATRLKVMLTWNDPAGAANAAFPLVNNLNLSLIQGSETTNPWILDRFNPNNNAVRGTDTISNIEQVTIDNPSGTYTVRVQAIDIPTGPSQQYFVSWEIESTSIEMIYPNGSESFNPGSTETITWNNSGITSTQTIEYSVDNGANWIVISNTVSPSVTRFSWTVPSTFSSTALVRVSSGSISDVSDQTFNIMGRVTGFAAGVNCTAGQLTLNWNATANATGYDILRLNEATAEWEVAAANITGTTHTFTGLTPLSNAWYSIVAKNGAAASLRTTALQATASIAGTAIGSITGTNTLCEGSTLISYSVPAVTGATSYSWTLPAGAQITSGTNTNNITVSFPAGTVSNNITVAAIDTRGCASNTSTRFITINPAPAKPVITSNSVQLTAPAGFSQYKWFLNSIEIAGATSNIYTPTANGQYQVEVTNATGCKNISDNFNFITTSLNEVTVSGTTISVFPNPAKDFISLRVAQQLSGRIEVSLLSIDGKLMKQTVLTNGVSQLDVSTLPQGNYMLKIQSRSETKTIKVTVSH